MPKNNDPKVFSENDVLEFLSMFNVPTLLQMESQLVGCRFAARTELTEESPTPGGREELEYVVEIGEKFGKLISDAKAEHLKLKERL